jgi:hypothetical protein
MQKPFSAQRAASDWSGLQAELVQLVAWKLEDDDRWVLPPRFTATPYRQQLLPIT